MENLPGLWEFGICEIKFISIVKFKVCLKRQRKGNENNVPNLITWKMYEYFRLVGKQICN